MEVFLLFVSFAVILTGAFMVSYIVLGGMLATSWVQIIKAVMLMTAAVVMTIWVLAEVSWNPIEKDAITPPIRMPFSSVCRKSSTGPLPMNQAPAGEMTCRRERRYFQAGSG